MRRSLIQRTAVFLCAGALIATAAGAQTPPDPSVAAAGSVPDLTQNLAEKPAAVVNDEIITNWDVIQRVQLLVVQNRVPSAQLQSLLPLLEQEALNQLIDQAVELQDLQKEQTSRKTKTLIMSDKDVNSQIDDLAAQNSMSRQTFLDQLQSIGLDPDAYRKQTRVDGSWDNWVRSLYSDHLAASERDIQLYQQTQAQAATKTRYHVEEIELDPSRFGGMDSTLSGAATIVDQVHGGGSFATAARNVSSAASAANGGDMGLITPDVLPPEVAKALEGMKVGDYSAPIVATAQQHVYLLHLVDKRDPSQDILATLKEALVAGGSGADAAAKLNQVRANATSGCDGFEGAAGRVRGVTVQNLGEASIADLAPVFRDAVSQLRPGQVSAPLQSSAGLAVIAVCSKRNGGDAALSHDQVANLLAGNKLDQIKRGLLRDLRAQATIVTQ